MFDDYTTDELIKLRDELDQLKRTHRIASMSTGPCGHPRRGSFPSCRACIQKEIERRQNESKND